ncbi:hypothetical protein MMC28_000578 [Mycoblastus sanguinarius]|nr:hypothetical protein [Mycoblastus sanguinarius]
MYSSSSRDQDTQKPPTKKLRTACDICHQAKMKCSGGSPCAGCRDSGYECFYSVSNRIGRPKGTKNKRTLDRMNRQQSDNESANHSRKGSISVGGQTPPALSLPSQEPTMPFDNASIDTMLSNTSEGSYSLPTSDTFDPFSDSLNSWYDFGDLAETSPLKQHSSSIPSVFDDTTGAFVNQDPLTFPHDDSAYVSPGSIFGSGTDLSSLSGSLGKTMSRGSDRYHMPPSTSSSSSVPNESSSSCNCLQHHAELLCRLKDLQQRHSQPRIDVVLSGAQQALVPWKSVIECRICQHEDNQEVLLLSAMSIRTVLRSLQSLCLDNSTAALAGADYSAVGRTRSPVSGNDTLKSSIGIYEITGEERTAVTDLLISRTLDKIKYTLACFKERLEAVRNKKQASVGSTRKASMHDGDSTLAGGKAGDLDHLLQVWRNLEGIVQMLGRVLRSGNLIPPHLIGDGT